MRSDIDRVLIARDRIAGRVAELAGQIVADHAPPNVEGDAEVTIVPVLTGAMIFCCDLIRHMPIYLRIGLMTVSSYPGTATRSQGATVLDQKLADVRGRHVVLVDDILDSGNTLRLIVPIVRDLGAASVKTCVLLRKDRPAARGTPCDYVGFDIPDEFVVGYGLDYNNFYRNLPDIVTLRPAAIERHA